MLWVTLLTYIYITTEQEKRGKPFPSALTVTSHTDKPLLDLPPLEDTQHGAETAVLANQMLDHLLWPVIEGHHGLISQNTGTSALSDEAGGAVESVVLPLFGVQPTTTFHTKLPDCSNNFISNDNIEDALPAEDRSLRCVKIIHISHLKMGEAASVGNEDRMGCFNIYTCIYCT